VYFTFTIICLYPARERHTGQDWPMKQIMITDTLNSTYRHWHKNKNSRFFNDSW
jgi:hypothetical protein